MQSRVEEESARHGDIVQGNFGDEYRHLAYKHLMGLNWAHTYCGEQASIVLKMDDDIAVDLFRLMDRAGEEQDQEEDASWIMGYVQSSLSPQRDPKSKWFVSREEYADEEYPDFLSGWAYVASRKAVSGILSQVSSFDE